MDGRRRDPRFVPSPPWYGTLHMEQEVTLERIDEADVIVVSDAPVPQCEAVTLEILQGGLRVDGLVVDSEAVTIDGSRSHRGRLRVETERTVGGSTMADMPREGRRSGASRNDGNQSW